MIHVYSVKQCDNVTLLDIESFKIFIYFYISFCEFHTIAFKCALIYKYNAINRIRYNTHLCRFVFNGLDAHQCTRNEFN